MMSSSISIALLWITALSSGLIAGVYFAFSAFIMQAFSRINETQSIAAMNAINVTILRSLFMPLFFGSSILSVFLIVFSFVYWEEAGAELALIAGLIYFIGMFLCTVIFNVPLNNSLAKIDLNSDDAYSVWSRYLIIWTRWNHLRTVSSIITCVLCFFLLSNY